MTPFEGRGAAGRADYAVAAEREATESGMAKHGFWTALRSETIPILIPPDPQETGTAYGLRATGEIRVRHRMDNGSRTARGVRIRIERAAQNLRPRPVLALSVTAQREFSERY